MLDQAGFVEITCRDEQKEEIGKALVREMAKMCAKLCGLGFDVKLEEYAARELCIVKHKKAGIYAELIDIQSESFCQADKFFDSNISNYGDINEITYQYLLNTIFDCFPEILLHAEIRVSNHYMPDRYELYETKNGKLIRKPAVMCACCERFFALESGLYPYKNLEAVSQYLDSEGTLGICSLKCAKKLAADPSCDEYGLLEMIEAEGDSIEHIIEHYLENHPEEK